MPTSTATSSTVMASNPFSASNRFTAETMASSRAMCICSRKLRLGRVPGRGVGVALAMGIL
ncbi:hypothetical protein D9M68_895890 [compost metagenome]